MRTKVKAKHRWTWLVNLLYAEAFIGCGVWMVAEGRIAAAGGLAMYVLPVVAFVLDIWNTPTEER